MKYEKFTVIVDPYDEELASYLLFECGATGISFFDSTNKKIETGDDTFDYVDENAFQSMQNMELIKKYPDKCLLTLFFEKGGSELKFQEMAKNTLKFPFEMIKESVDDSEWIDEWKKYYEPFQIGELWVVPTWKNDAGLKKKIVLDPGIAFGTGLHETTSMILSQIQSQSITEKTVIDIGCGSGILGIGAILLGAKSCHFIDVEKRAVDISKANCISSGVMEKCTFENGCFKSGPKKYDVILANLTAGIIISLSSDLIKTLNCGGILFASGIIDGREEEVQTELIGVGLKLIKTDKQGDWHSIVMIKEKI